VEKIELDGDQMSLKMADLIVGIHLFKPEWDHTQRVMMVSDLLMVYSMVREMGELEHTSDWDWRITVEAFLGGRTWTLGTALDEDDDLEKWADTFRWPESYSVQPRDYTNRFGAWKFIEVEEFPSMDSDKPEWKAVSVDHITRIAILFA